MHYMLRPTVSLSLLDMLTYPVQLIEETKVAEATKMLSALMKRLRIWYATIHPSSRCRCSSKFTSLVPELGVPCADTAGILSNVVTKHTVK